MAHSYGHGSKNLFELWKIPNNSSKQKSPENAVKELTEKPRKPNKKMIQFEYGNFKKAGKQPFHGLPTMQKLVKGVKCIAKLADNTKELQMKIVTGVKGNYATGFRRDSLAIHNKSG